MSNIRIALVVPILALGLGIGIGFAQHSGHQHGQPSRADTPSTTAFKASHMRMMKAMEVEYTGDPDVDFVRGMIPHHQGAIDMAKVQLAHGKNPEILKLAKQIIADQEKEITMMQDWLKKHAK